MKLAIRYGLITGGVSVIWNHIEYVAGISHSSFGGIAGFLPYFLLFAGIGVGIYFQRRSEEFGLGILTFREGARTGVVISLVTGLFLAGYSMLYGLVINPFYLQEYLDFVRESLEAVNETPAQIERQIADIKKDGSVGQLMFSKFMITLIIGIVGSFLIAATLKKERSGPTGNL